MLTPVVVYSLAVLVLIELLPHLIARGLDH